MHAFNLKSGIILTTSSENLALSSSWSGMGRAGTTACKLRVPAPSTTQYVISGGSSSFRQPQRPFFFSLVDKLSIVWPPELRAFCVCFEVDWRLEKCAWRPDNFLAKSSGFGRMRFGGLGRWTSAIAGGSPAVATELNT